MGTDLKIDKGHIPMNYHSLDLVRSTDNIMECLCLQKKLDVIILLPICMFLLVPQVLVPCTMEWHWDIHLYRVWWVGPQSEGYQDEQLGVMKFVGGLFLGLHGIIYQLIQQKSWPIQNPAQCAQFCELDCSRSALVGPHLVYQITREEPHGKPHAGIFNGAN